MITPKSARDKIKEKINYLMKHKCYGTVTAILEVFDDAESSEKDLEQLWQDIRNL